MFSLLPDTARASQSARSVPERPAAQTAMQRLVDDVDAAEEAEMRAQEGLPSSQPPLPTAAEEVSPAPANADAPPADDDEPADAQPEWPADKLSALEEQAASIKELIASKRGTRNTYPTTWKAYDKWHRVTYGADAPRCPLTQLIWVSRRMAAKFLRHYANKAGT